MKNKRREIEQCTSFNSKEEEITYYEMKLDNLLKSNDLNETMASVDISKPPIGVFDDSFFHDIESDHELTAREIEKIRHGNEFSFRDFFRSILMANEPAQRVHK